MLRFRQPVGVERLAALSLTDVVELAPGRLDRWCGWYAGSGRRVLLTQFPEGYFGESMVMVGEGEVVARTYPVGPERLLGTDGLVWSLVETDEGAPAVLLGEGESAILLGRDERYREREVEFRVADDTFSATLITPAEGGPHPAAVVVHGAAGGQRDFGRLFVEPVLASGVAVLLYDKQGHGRSTGTPEVTIFDQARAAAAGLDRIAGEPDIDADRLGLLGFSNGMWAVPMIAAERDDVAFVVGIGSPGVSMAESEVHRRAKVLREAGLEADTIEAVAQAWRCIFAIAGTGRADDASITALSAAVAALSAAEDLKRYEIPGYAQQNPMLSAVPPLGPVEELVQMLSGDGDAELGHDPAVDYARVRCPVLLQWGAQDTSVPVDVSVQRISAALPEPGTASLLVYPDVEHMLNVVVPEVRGISAEEAMYGFHGFRFGPRTRDDLREWLSTVR
jgi:pimeloyl-ACP methyl ester carboxylesterase